MNNVISLTERKAKKLTTEGFATRIVKDSRKYSRLMRDIMDAVKLSENRLK